MTPRRVLERNSPGVAPAEIVVKGMQMVGYAVAHVDEIAEIDDGRAPMRAVRHHFGITSFGANAWAARQAGARIINEHDESEPDSQEELYLVLRGRASFEVDGEKFDAPCGTFVFVRPGVRRTAFAQEPDTTIVAFGGVPGKPYEAGGWELFAPLRPLYEAADYAEAADRGRELLAGDPPYADLFYNVACCESLAGRNDEAIAHLRRAIELSERTRSYLEGDSDLDPIREDPAFKALLAE
jgi:tetratricopeptide (TPR) repeat protein